MMTVMIQVHDEYRNPLERDDITYYSMTALNVKLNFKTNEEKGGLSHDVRE